MNCLVESSCCAMLVRLMENPRSTAFFTSAIPASLENRGQSR